MCYLFDRPFASSVVNSALAWNIFEIPKERGSSIIFLLWLDNRLDTTLLGLYLHCLHHMVVWWAAEQARPGELLDKYAVLGDDIVITDPAVVEVDSSALT